MRLFSGDGRMGCGNVIFFCLPTETELRLVFLSQMTASSLTECGTYEISVVSQPGLTSFGVPPYYLMAWKANGVPTVSPIGSDRSSLSWQVNQASGTYHSLELPSFPVFILF